MLSTPPTSKSESGRLTSLEKWGEIHQVRNTAISKMMNAEDMLRNF